MIAATGLLGSGHCLGMCGPIVWAYAARLPAEVSWAARLGAHLAYNLGRVGMWVFLGLSLGMAGGMLGGLAPVGRILALGGGVAMLALGLANLGLFPLRFRLEGEGGNRLWRVYRRLFQALIGAGGPSGKFALGLANGLLPCGLSYALLARAGATGSPVEGGLVMLAFGLGTVPVLLGAGLLLGRFRLPRWSERLAAVAVLAMGAGLLWRGWGGHGGHAGH
jgi:sulfite exporter TauE/SafE